MSRTRAREAVGLADVLSLPAGLVVHVDLLGGPCPIMGRPPYDREGYKRVGKTSLHRAAWEWFNGPVPPGLVLDHATRRGCASRACCTPWHLEPVTRAVNTLRGSSPPAVNAAKTHCATCGTPYDEANTYRTPSGSRGCRSCIRRGSAEYRTRQSQGVPQTTSPLAQDGLPGSAAGDGTLRREAAVYGDPAAGRRGTSRDTTRRLPGTMRAAFDPAANVCGPVRAASSELDDRIGSGPGNDRRTP